MKIRILGCESFGIRSMACVVETAEMKVVIDPGTALGPKRFRLPPHPLEQEAAQEIQKQIHDELAEATHVIITHFHGDHHPMVEADISQLNAQKVLPFLKRTQIMAKGTQSVSRRQKHRRWMLEQLLDKSLITADGGTFGPLSFSVPVPHGEKGNKAGSVIMVNLIAEGFTFVHGSDIQLLDQQAVEILCYWKPDIVFLAGPPLYILGLQRDLLADIEHRLELLASSCGMVIIDHHLLRSREGEGWLDRMAEAHSRAGRRNIICAADFSKRPRCLLEADRKRLY